MINLGFAKNVVLRAYRDGSSPPGAKWDTSAVPGRGSNMKFARSDVRESGIMRGFINNEFPLSRYPNLLWRIAVLKNQYC